MDENLPPTRCPACSSEMVRRIGTTGLWECRYHLCRAVFMVYPRRHPSQALLIREEGPDSGPEERGKE